MKLISIVLYSQKMGHRFTTGAKLKSIVRAYGKNVINLKIECDVDVTVMNSFLYFSVTDAEKYPTTVDANVFHRKGV